MKRFLSLLTCAALLAASVPAFGADQPSLSLEDLGFKNSETQANPELQHRLEERTSMLKTHQVLGLITAIPMVAQIFTSNNADKSAGARNIHMGLGIGTAVLYGATASFALFAPKPAGIQDKGTIKVHKALAWVHGPLMIITPILGGLAYSQVSNGEKTHGLASYHGAAAALLITSYLASIAVMSFNF